MEGEAHQPIRQAQEEDGQRGVVLRVPRQIPEPRLPLAEREEKVGPRRHDVRPIRLQVPRIRRGQIGKQALRLQKAEGTQEGLPQRHHGVDQRLLGRREVLGARALHGPLEQRDRRHRTIEPQRRQEHLFRRPRDGRREDNENRQAQSDFARRSRLRLRVEGLQRGETVCRIGLSHSEGLQGKSRKGGSRPQKAEQNKIREEAKDNRRGKSLKKPTAKLT